MAVLLIGGSIILALFLLWIERWHLILPGAWPALKWLGFRKTRPGGLPGIWYGRRIASYLKFLRKMARICGPPGRYAQWLENTYHGKVLTHALARSIISVEEDIHLQAPGAGVIPYSRVRDIVINEEKYKKCGAARSGYCSSGILG